MESSAWAVAFKEPTFTDEVRAAAKARWLEVPAQVRYLAAYLSDQEVGTRTMLVEAPYVDRHYLQEYVGHYATTLRPVVASATRIHFFRRSFDDADWDALLTRAAKEQGDNVERELQADYLGYVVVRPIPSCPIGRTLLRPYGERGSRCYAPAATLHEVHLHGFTFRVDALPFQQQDRALGACATTALWSALARATRADGGRAVTPLDVARSVPGAHGALVGSPQGLDLDQMRAAVRALGYDPHVISPTDVDEFLLAVKTYVRSGFPVVLRLRIDEHEVHAATIAGVRVDDEEESARDIEIRSGEHRATAAGLTRLYLHDDRLGPYARFVFEEPTAEEREEAEEQGYASPVYVTFEPRKNGFESYQTRARVESALIPLYPKIRMNAKALLECAAEYLPVVCGIAGPRRDGLRLEPFFALGGSYLAQLGRVLTEPARVAALRRTAMLSRYVGVLRFHLGDEWLLDLVIDTTDVLRGRSEASPLILATALRDETLASLRHLEDELGSVLIA